MKLRCIVAVLAVALVLPLAGQAQTSGGASEGTAVTVAGVSAITVNRPASVTTAVRLRERPSTSGALIEYWSTTTQKEPELFMPVGAKVLVVARTVGRTR